MNYKKWDDMAKDMSDSDDEKKGKVRVTRLEQPSQVTFGHGKEIKIVQESPSSSCAPKGGAAPAATKKSGSIDYSRWDKCVLPTRVHSRTPARFDAGPCAT